MWRLFPGAARTTWEHLLGERDDHKSSWKLVKVYKNAYWYLIRLKKTYTIGAYSKGCCSMMKKLMQNWVPNCSMTAFSERQCLYDSTFWAVSCTWETWSQLNFTSLSFQILGQSAVRSGSAQLRQAQTLPSFCHIYTQHQHKPNCLLSFLHWVELRLECKRVAAFSYCTDTVLKSVHWAGSVWEEGRSDFFSGSPAVVGLLGSGIIYIPWVSVVFWELPIW